MSNPDYQQLGFYLTPGHACSYLPGREAHTLFADPDYPITAGDYSLLAQRGFRRSGDYLYQPHCRRCAECISVRIPVREFIWKRTFTRTWKRNQDLTIRTDLAVFRPEHEELYVRYMKTRHQDGSPDLADVHKHLSFMNCVWMDTRIYEMRRDRKLLAVAVVDKLDHALSAVYTFFDPVEARRSLGTFAILYEINEARRQGLDWLYLGYWIKSCNKMNYKNAFAPLEYYRHNAWTRTP